MGPDNGLWLSQAEQWSQGRLPAVPDLAWLPNNVQLAATATDAAEKVVIALNGSVTIGASGRLEIAYS